MLTTLQASFQLIIPNAVVLPKGTVTTGPSGSPYIVYHPVTVTVPGLKSTDVVSSSLTTSPDAGKAVIVGVYDGYLIVQNASYTTNETLSGVVTVTRSVEPFNVYSVGTDADGYITIAHGLNRNPDKWLVTSSVGPNQEPVVLNFVSSDTNNLTLRAFSNNSPLVSSSIKISLLLN